jgi:hypothetical protein
MRGLAIVAIVCGGCSLQRPEQCPPSGAWQSRSLILRVGSDGVHRSEDAGATWVRESSSGANDVFGVGAPGDWDAFAVGQGGALWRASSPQWSRYESGTTADLHSVVNIAGDWYAAGDAGTVIKMPSPNSDPTAPVRGWRRVEVPATERLWCVFGTARDDVQVIGEGVALRWDGSAWER